jgi:glycosyltransferase involved in cell wall biosynthesis
MPEVPKVSIIINCRNGARYLREAMDSIYAQTCSDWEIIFWDNMSEDESPEIAGSYDSRVRYFRSEEPLSLGAARNKAIEQATGEFVAFLDSDDIWTPDHLSLHLSAFDDDTDVVYGNFIVRIEEAGVETVPFSPSREFYDGRITDRLCRKNFIWLQALLVRTGAVRRLDPVFDPEMLTAEDYDFILRLSMSGNFRHIPEVTFIYRTHESNLTMSRRHYFAHDFSLLLEKYKNTLEKPMLRNLARQYLMTVRLDLSAVGLRAFPFLRLGLSLRQMMASLAFLLFPDTDIWSLKARLRKPVEAVDSFLSLFRGREK